MSKKMKKILNEWKVYSDNHELFEQHDYIQHILGIQPLLNESGGIYYDSNLKQRIVEEQQLFEGFFSDLVDSTKQFGEDASNIFKVLKELISDPSRINTWRSNVTKQVIRKPISKIVELLKMMKESLSQYNMPTFAKWAEETESFIQNAVKSIKEVDGWKGAMLWTSFGLALRWIWSKIGDTVTSALKGFKGIIEKLAGDTAGDYIDEVKEWITEKVVQPLKSFMIDKIKSAMKEAGASLTGIGAWFSWAKKAFEGAQFVLNTLSGALGRQTHRLDI
mgnify:CR=1 FL=1